MSNMLKFLTAKLVNQIFGSPDKPLSHVKDWVPLQEKNGKNWVSGKEVSCLLRGGQL